MENLTTLRPEDLISERDAYAKHGHLLASRELRHARQKGQIGWTKRKGKIFYSRAEVDQYIVSGFHEAEQTPETPAAEETPPCQTTSSELESTGSTRSTAPKSGTDSGMTPELEKLGAARLASRSSKTLK